jgi:hypothetical protein
MEPAPLRTVADPASRNIKKRRQQLRILAACVLIATCLWFLRAFENEFTTSVDHPVRYINVPEKMIAISPLPQRIRLEVKGLGFSILRHNWNFSKTPLIIDIKNIKAFNTVQKKGFSVHLPMNQFLGDFSTQLKDLRVLAIKPDTVIFRLAVKKTRSLPVTGAFMIDSRKVAIADSLFRISPATVEVSGPDLILDTMKQVVTEPMQLKRNGAPFTGTVALRSKDNLLKFRPEKVSVTLLENR